MRLFFDIHGREHHVLFTGTHELSIDSKNRMAVPSEVRGLIRQVDQDGNEAQVTLYVTYGGHNILSVYTKDGYESQANATPPVGSPPPTQEMIEYETLMYSLASKADMDKTGRILVPKHLRELVGIGTEVVLIGAKDHWEIRDRAAWYEYRRVALEAKKQQLMNPRLATPTGTLVAAK